LKRPHTSFNPEPAGDGLGASSLEPAGDGGGASGRPKQPSPPGSELNAVKRGHQPHYNGNVNASNIDDFRWLVGADAAAVLDRAMANEDSVVTLARALRASLPPPRVHLILQQIELRRRALQSKKFSLARQMFFTPNALEQATDEMIARYKAHRFPSDGPVVDLCCGISGDLLALAGRTSTTGVDHDPITCMLARKNCRATGHGDVTVHMANVADFSAAEFAAWHLDPDRRPQGRRTSRPDQYEPDVTVVDRLLAECDSGAIKLAPAAQTPVS